MKKELLHRKIIQVLKEQGFKINPHVRPCGNSKRTYKRLQQKARLEQILLHKKFIERYFEKVKMHCMNGKDIIPNEITLELREIHPNSLEEILFKWWNFIWWSIPYQRAYGRTMRFLLWDVAHNAPFGLICLQSPVLKMSVRDNYLNIPNNELDLWINKSMNAQRVGALPPYNDLIGGKMVALALTANEIRKTYKKKYKNYISLIKHRKLSADILFITTTSAFGRSSLYNRLKYKDELVAKCLGYTQGSGTFHIPKNVYEEILQFLKSKGVNVARGYGNGPSRKLRLIVLGLRYLGISSFAYHGIKREFYLFPLVKNLREVIRNKEDAVWYDRPFDELVDYWKKRWAVPRAERIPEWRDFKVNKFFKKINNELRKLGES
ncbi:hypothetical protein ES705_03967 [subsurface metagenome]